MGQPGADIIPKDLIDKTLIEVCNDNKDPYIYQYSSTVGTTAFKKSISAFIQRQCGIQVDIENLSPSFGNSAAINAISRTMAKPHDIVVVEELSYYLAGTMFKEAGLEVRAVGVDDEGMRVDELEDMLRKNNLRPRLVYLVPCHHNPTSVNLAEARRLRLIALADEFDFIVVSDEPYIFLNFSRDGQDRTGPPMTPLAYKPPPGGGGGVGGAHDRVLSLMSVSKILTPGLRVGWVHGAARLLQRVQQEGTYISGGGPPSLLCEAVRILLDSQAFSLSLSPCLPHPRHQASSSLPTSHPSPLLQILLQHFFCDLASAYFFSQPFALACRRDKLA